MVDQYLFCSAIEPFWSEIDQWLTVILSTVLYNKIYNTF